MFGRSTIKKSWRRIEIRKAVRDYRSGLDVGASSCRAGGHKEAVKGKGVVPNPDSHYDTREDAIRIQLRLGGCYAKTQIGVDPAFRQSISGLVSFHDVIYYSFSVFTIVFVIVKHDRSNSRPTPQSECIIECIII